MADSDRAKRFITEKQCIGGDFPGDSCHIWRAAAAF
jgi:hypothetical protein